MQKVLGTGQAFEPAAYRRSLARIYGDLGEREKVELINHLSTLPRYVHSMAVRGLIADRLPVERPH